MEASEGADGSVQSESEVDSSVDNGFESSGGSEEHVFDGLSSHDEDEASGSIRDVSVAGSDVDDADADVSDGSDPAIDDEEMALICGLPVNTAPPAAATTATTPSTDYVLPTVRLNEGVVLPSDREERRQLVTQMLTADSPSRLHTIAFAREVFSQLPTSELVGEHVTAVFGSPEIYIAPGPVCMAAPSQTTPVNFRVELPFEQQLPLRTLTYQQRCDCCDDEIGTGVSGSCGALQLLATLEDEMKCRDEIILSEVNAGQEDPSSLLKSARFFMYRAFVAAKYGHLGQGNRVRIPECVVAVIRLRFRSPECDCDASAIGRCSAHGHTGYQAVSRRDN